MIRLVLRRVASRPPISQESDGVQQVEDIYKKLRSQGRVVDAKDRQQDAEERFKRALEYKYQREKATIQAQIDTTAAAHTDDSTTQINRNNHNNGGNGININANGTQGDDAMKNGGNESSTRTTAPTAAKNWWQFWQR